MSGLVLLAALLLLDGAILSSRATVVNSCSSTAKHLCNFVCYCSDCSDENQCGYLGVSAVLGTPFTCDFEEGDCGWQDVSTTAYRWVRGRASLDKWGTGLHSDHTVGTDRGWFMVTVSPPAKATATAWLRSPAMQDVAATCEIWASYHLSGSSECSWVPTTSTREGKQPWEQWWTEPLAPRAGSQPSYSPLPCPTSRAGRTLLQSPELSGSESPHSHPGEPTAKGHILGLPAGLNQTAWPTLRLAMASRDKVVELWQSPQHGAEGWHQLVAYTGRITGQFQLTFALTQPPACGAVLALDDIVFRNCGLQTPAPGQQVCGAEENRCSQGSCLAPDRFCDGTDDCGDSSDEAVQRCQNFNTCSFENGFCSWVEAGQTTWERNTSMNLGATYGIPTRDHSINSAAGYFLHISSASAAGSSSMASLSISIISSNSSCYLVLYCHLHGSATSSLSISYMTNSTEQLVRQRTGDTGSCWVRERVDFNVTESFKVLIKGVARSGGTVAIDDLILSPGCTPHLDPSPMALPGQDRASTCMAREFTCDDGSCISSELACDFAKTCTDGSDEKLCGATTFEEGDGGWHDVSVGRLRWAIQRATEPSAIALAGAGAFLALQEGEGQMVAPAKARTPLLGPSGLACSMEMSYHIQSGPQGFLAVSVVDHTTGMTHLAWHVRGHGSMAWGHVHILLGERARPFQVELLGLVDLQDQADAAIDNVTFVQCDPNVVPPGATELSCNFETGLCGWYQDQASDFQWVHSTGQGQGSDHTTGSGYFLAANPSAPWSRGQRAQLITYGQEPAATPRCLTFWYRLAGPQIGTLNLKLQLEGAEETVLWTQRGTQGSLWHRGLATLPATGQQRYRLAFEALRDGFVGDAALDDLLVTEGTCGAELSCSFEADTCGLTGSTQPTWLRQSNSTGTIAGPPADHTTGTAAGHYMVVSTSKGSLPMGHKATLTSAPYQPSAPAQCLAFWYQLSTGDPGSLSILVEDSGVLRKLFSMSTMEGDTWHRSQATVQADGDWKAIFEVVGAGGDYGYIALDDLHVSDGACPEPVSCDFELDMCGWSSPVDEHLHSFAWGWKSGVPLAKYPGPEQDHTLGTKNGHYVHFDTRMLGAGGTTAQLVSQHLPATADSCLRFWYHMDIPEHLSDGELRVRLQSASGQRTAWTVAGHSSRGWQNGTVPVQSPSEFQIIFEITTRIWPMEGTVALDDIEYSTTGGCDSSPDTQGKEKSSRGFVAEVVLSILLAIIILALAVASGWYWLKRRGQGSRMSAESSTPQGFDNITFRDDKVIISPVQKERDED